MSSQQGKQRFFADKRQGVLYSLYLVLGGISLFVFINAGYVTIEAILWQYTSTYIVNAGIITLVAFIAGCMFLLGCFGIIKGRKLTKTTGIIGSLLLIVYPLVALSNQNMPSSFENLLFMIVPAVFILVLTIVWRRYLP